VAGCAAVAAAVSADTDPRRAAPRAGAGAVGAAAAGWWTSVVAVAAAEAAWAAGSGRCPVPASLGRHRAACRVRRTTR